MPLWNYLRVDAHRAAGLLTGAAWRPGERTTASSDLAFPAVPFRGTFRLAGTKHGSLPGGYAGAGHNDTGPLPRDP